jgi:uncharacterized membrane protein YozB (DUF420 family)
VTASPEPRQPPFASAARLEHAFYFGMALVLVALVATGFAPTFFARDVSVAGPLSSPVLVHGIAGTVWVLLFAAQVALIATRRVAWHRRVGLAAAAVTVAFVVSGALVTAALERSHGTEPLSWLAAHIFTNGAPLTLFALLVAAGVWQRSRAARHKRLMLLAAVVLSPPAIGRLFGQLGLTELNLVAYATLAFANASYDWLAHGRPHAISLLGATALVAVDVATTAWLAAVGS